MAMLPLAVLAFEAAFRASAKAEFGAHRSASTTILPNPVIDLSDRPAGTARGRRFQPAHRGVPVRAA